VIFVLNFFTGLLAGVVFVLIGIVFAEVMGAVRSKWSEGKNDGKDVFVSAETPSVAILMPAHNETAVIQHTLSNLQPHLQENDRVIVIADNCTDNTAALARAFNQVTVIERQHDTKRGKGYALDYGRSHLKADPPDIVVVLDADCLLADGTLSAIVSQSFATNKPVQAIYLLDPPPEPSPKDQVSAFAFLVKNLVRPLGLYGLGQPCLLTGTGMAFPWGVLQSASLASGNIVEDMQLGLDLAIGGYAPQIAPNTLAHGGLPQAGEAATSQRTRWEHGHLKTLLTQVPRLLRASLAQRRFDLLALALELSVPPLSLLVALWGGVLVVTGLATLIGGSVVPFLLSGIAGILLLIAIGIAWAKFGRHLLPFKTLLSVPFYILWKIPLYFKFLVRPQNAWVRTERDNT
jgi:cellulose synthase/poly-beta-1,6-N-acetylglucosamine synthase-like glycosyltransferase